MKASQHDPSLAAGMQSADPDFSKEELEWMESADIGIKKSSLHAILNRFRSNPDDVRKMKALLKKEMQGEAEGAAHEADEAPSKES